MWNEDYKQALDCCRKILGHLSGDDLKGYRAFWNYLAGSAAWLGSQKGITGLDQIAQDYYKRAATIAPQIRWLTELSDESSQEPNQADNTDLMNVIERLEAFLEKCGTINNQKFDAEVKKITDQLNSNKATVFEKGHELLGNFLGFDAGNAETTAAPDPWWRINNKLCIVFEDHSPENVENCIGANKVRQAESHPKWIRRNIGDLQDNAIIIPVIISPCSKIDKDAIPYAGDVRYWKMRDFMKWALNAIGIVRDLRRNFPGRGNLGWRAEASDEYKKNKIAPRQLIDNILKQKLSELEQS
jgi:hypothetical protein